MSLGDSYQESRPDVFKLTHYRRLSAAGMWDRVPHHKLCKRELWEQRLQDSDGINPDLGMSGYRCTDDRASAQQKKTRLQNEAGPFKRNAPTAANAIRADALKSSSVTKPIIEQQSLP
jgi:hypothetical protein